jgi:serine protease Do
VELYLQYYPDADLGTRTGVFVSQIYQGSPADIAGLKQGDVITNMDDITIRTMNQLTRELFSYEPGERVNLTVYRDGQKIEVLVTLGTMPQQ